MLDSERTSLFDVSLEQMADDNQQMIGEEFA